jgi:hypothetical protein
LKKGLDTRRGFGVFFSQSQGARAQTEKRRKTMTDTTATAKTYKSLINEVREMFTGDWFSIPSKGYTPREKAARNRAVRVMVRIGMIKETGRKNEDGRKIYYKYSR